MQPQTGKTRYHTGDLIADRYKVRRVLGRGGMGVVYLVVDMETQEQRALKTILPQYSDNKTAIRRFYREVQTIRRLKHPAIVNIYDAGRLDAVLYYTMDYVNGKSLNRWIEERGRLGIGSTVRILALLADVLEHAHQHTIHRDISPENVMVLSDGTVRLLDFGLAKLVDNEGAFTMVGASLGKLQYKAPEQGLNATGVDGRADLYSLGVMFYVMLSGKFPKRGVKLTDLVPELARDCDDFVAKATARSPDERFADAREFRGALMHVYNICTGKATSAYAAPEPPPVPFPDVPLGSAAPPRRTRRRPGAPMPEPPPTSSARLAGRLRGWVDGVMGWLRRPFSRRASNRP